MSYKYVVLAPGERQYEVNDDNIVQARYIKSKISSDNGNPYIEALPVPRNKDEIFNVYNKPFRDYNKNEQLKWEDYEKISLITTLRQVRFALPFHNDLENEFYLALLKSYRERQNIICQSKIIKQDNEEIITNKLIGNNGAATNAGVTLLGCSGCGKSAAIEILLSNYPQVIEHENDLMDKFTQITYLVVVCPANSNFSALYTSIGAEIDKALRNDRPFYEKMIRNKRSLAEKADMVCKLIQLFGIGCIIFDEIQLINFNSNKENTYEGLLTIVNKTKVALMIVGTKDAYDKIFKNVRTARRTGTYIDANSYCTNKGYFSTLVNNLWHYQWFDEYIPLTNTIIKALYDVTKGIIDQLISIYMYMQMDYVLSSKKPIIDEKYVYYISEKYFPGMRKLLSDIDNPYTNNRIEQLKQERKDSIMGLVYQEAEKSIINEYMEQYNSPEFVDKMYMRNNIIANIKSTLKIIGEVYNDIKIEQAVDYILNVKRNEKLTESELSQKAYKYLKSKKSDKRPKTKRRALSDKELDEKIKGSI